MKPGLIVRDYLRTTRRQLLRWMVGTAGSLVVGSGSRATPEVHRSEVRWRELERQLGTRLVLKGKPGYERDRQAAVWNAAKPDRYPDAIVHAASTEDVKAAIRFAGRNRLKVAVRAGGHHFNAPALRQSGLLLDLSRLDRITVDAEARTAVVQPAATGRELMAALAPHRLAFPVGHCSGVALSGFLLNGGIGWNSGAWGPACLSVKGLDIVDAGGEAIFADADRYPDLYWAARGAGLGFPGVVTRFHLNVHPLPKAIRTSTLLYRVDDMDAVARWIAKIQGSLPPQVELVCLVVSPPAEARADGAPPRVIVVTATAFADTLVDAERWLAPLASGPEGLTPIGSFPLVDTPFEALFASIDGAFPADHRYASDHVWSNSAPGQLLAAVRDTVLSAPSPRDFLLLAFTPPRQPEAPPLPDMALSVFGAVYAGIYGVWNDVGSDEENRSWVRSMNAALEGVRMGRYIGDADVEAGVDRSRQCFSASAWERLSALKKRYDPDDLFFSYSMTG